MCNCPRDGSSGDNDTLQFLEGLIQARPLYFPIRSLGIQRGDENESANENANANEIETETESETDRPMNIRNKDNNINGDDKINDNFVRFKKRKKAQNKKIIPRDEEP